MSSLPPTVAPATAPTRPWGFWATLGLTFVITVAFIIAQSIVFAAWVIFFHKNISATEAASNGFILALATCVTMPVVLGLAWLFTWVRAGPTTVQHLGLRAAPRQEFFRWGAGMVVLVILSDGLTKLMGRPMVPDSMVKAYQTAGFVPLFWFALMV